MIDFPPESNIKNIKVLKPDVPSNLVPALAPDVLLLIESGLIGRQIFQMNLSMALKEEPYLFSFVPFSSVYVEMDNITAELFQHMLQHLYESLAVTCGGAYQAFPPQQRRHPAGQIEPLAMLTGGRDFEPLTFLSPASPEARMQAKTGLILENDGLVVFKAEQFFLTPGESGGHPWHGPGDKCSWLFSGCNPNNAASIVPVVPSTLSQTASSDEPPEWDRPRQLSTNQTLGDSFPVDAEAVPLAMAPVESADLAGAWVSGSEHHSDLPRESTAPLSCDLPRTRRLPIPAADPPKSATTRRSLCRSMLPGFALPGPIAFPWSPRDALRLKLS
jgi:hypothetical protein